MLWLDQCSITLEKLCQSPISQAHAQLAQRCTSLHSLLTGVKSCGVRWVVCICGIDFPKSSTQSHIVCYITCFWCDCHRHSALISIIPSKGLSNHPVRLYFITFSSYSLHSASGTCILFVVHGVFCRLHFSSKTLLSQRQKRKQYMFAFPCLN